MAFPPHLPLFARTSRLRNHSPYIIRLKPPGCWEADKKENKTKCMWGATWVVSSIPNTAAFTEQKEGWASPASPDVPRPPVLHSLIPELYFSPWMSTLWEHTCDLRFVKENERGRFLNQAELTQVVSSTDSGLDPKAMWLRSLWSLHCSHQLLCGLSSSET